MHGDDRKEQGLDAAPLAGKDEGGAGVHAGADCHQPGKNREVSGDAIDGGSHMSEDDDKVIMSNGLQSHRVLRDPPRTRRVGPRRPQSAGNLGRPHELSDSLNSLMRVYPSLGIHRDPFWNESS